MHKRHKRSLIVSSPTINDRDAAAADDVLYVFGGSERAEPQATVFCLRRTKLGRQNR